MYAFADTKKGPPAAGNGGEEEKQEEPVAGLVSGPVNDSALDDKEDEQPEDEADLSLGGSETETPEPEGSTQKGN